MPEARMIATFVTDEEGARIRLGLRRWWPKVPLTVEPAVIEGENLGGVQAMKVFTDPQTGQEMEAFVRGYYEANRDKNNVEIDRETGKASLFLEAPTWWVDGRGQKSYLQFEKKEAFALLVTEPTFEVLRVTFQPFPGEVVNIAPRDGEQTLSLLDMFMFGKMKLEPVEAEWLRSLLKTALICWKNVRSG